MKFRFICFQKLKKEEEGSLAWLAASNNNVSASAQISLIEE